MEKAYPTVLVSSWDINYWPIRDSVNTCRVVRRRKELSYVRKTINAFDTGYKNCR